MGGDLTGAATSRCTAPPALADPATRPLWNGWGPTIENTHFQSAGTGGTHRRASAEPQTEVGVRISRHDLGVGTARRSSAAACSSAARTAPSTRSIRKRAASSGRSRPKAAFARPCRSRAAPPSARQPPAVRRVLFRSEGIRLRARRDNRRADLEAQGRGSSAHPAHRFARRLRRSHVRSHLVVRRIGKGPDLRLLHLPRQRRRPRRRRPGTCCGVPTRSPSRRR